MDIDIRRGFYDFKEHPSIDGYYEMVAKGCKSCSSSFNTGSECTCHEYHNIHLLPDPRTIPDVLLNDDHKKLIILMNHEDELSREFKRVDIIRHSIDRDKRRIYINLRKYTSNVFDISRLNRLSKFKTIGELKRDGYEVIKGEYLKDNKTRFLLLKDSYSIKVTINKRLKRLSNKTLIGMIELCETVLI